MEQIMTPEMENVLSRLHSTISNEDLTSLENLGYGELSRIIEVKGNAENFVRKILNGGNLTKEEIEKLNKESRKSRPILDPNGNRWTYQIIGGDRIDFWFPMFSQYQATGRMKECEYDECRRIYVPLGRGGKPSKYCSNSCYNKAVKVPYQRVRRQES